MYAGKYVSSFPTHREILPTSPAFLTPSSSIDLFIKLFIYRGRQSTHSVTRTVAIMQQHTCLNKSHPQLSTGKKLVIRQEEATAMQ